MARPIKKRPANTQEILQNLEEITEKLYPRKQLINQSINTIYTSLNLQKIKPESIIIGDLSSGHSACVTCLAVSSDGETLISGSLNGEIKVWDLIDCQEIYTVSGSPEAVESLAFFPGNENFVSSDGKVIRSWNLENGTQNRKYIGHTEKVTTVVVHPNGKKIFSGSFDNNIRQWSIDKLNSTHSYSKHSGAVTSLAITTDGKTMASSSFDQTIIVWPNYTLVGHKGFVWSVAISTDMKTIVSASEDKEIKVWNMVTGELIYTLTGHSEGVYTVAISPDGKIIASGGGDKTIKLWDLSSGEEITSINAHLDTVTCLVFSPNGKNLISGSCDYSIKLWQIN